MSVLRLLIAVALVTALASASPLPSDGPSPHQLGRPFDLAVGEAAFVELGLSVSFSEVAEDSRCPSDVVCVWEGNATVVLQVEAMGEAPASLRLDTNPGFETEATYQSFTVALVALEPYPKLEPPSREPYRATLLVTTEGDRAGASPAPSPLPSA